MAARVAGEVTAGTNTRAGAPHSRAIRATARPWLPSVAVTSTKSRQPAASARSPATPGGGAAPAGARLARTWRTAQDAPRTLNAGRPSRADSSFTKTRPEPSSAARTGAERLQAHDRAPGRASQGRAWLSSIVALRRGATGS